MIVALPFRFSFSLDLLHSWDGRLAGAKLGVFFTDHYNLFFYR